MIINEDIIKVLLAILIGGLIGLEREYRYKAAGFRTIILICTGSTIFTIFSEKLSQGNDPARIAANIVTGIGFLGAGVILRDRGRIIGLTTAATIWLTASIGMGIGSGYYAFSCITTGIILVVLLLFPIIENLIYKAYDRKIYEINSPVSLNKLEKLKCFINESNLSIIESHLKKTGDGIKCKYTIAGRQKSHEKLLKMMTLDHDIKDIKII